MNPRPLLIAIVFLLSLIAVHGQGFVVDNIRVKVSYPEPYDRYSGDRNDNDDEILDGEAIDADIFPGSVVEFKFEITNDFDEDNDTDLHDVVATITIEELDDGDDVEEDTDSADLDPGEEVDLTIPITIPTKVEDQEYTVTLLIEADINGSTEEEEFTFTLDVQKESHDLKLLAYAVTPEQVGCDRSVTIRATMANLGRNEETNAGIEAVSAALGLERREVGLTLDEDPFDEENQYSFIVPFTVPKAQKAGTYAIDIRALFQNEVQMDLRQLPLVVKDCGEKQEETKTEQPAKEQNASSGQQGSGQPSQETQEQLAQQPILTPSQNGTSQPTVEVEEEVSGSSVERQFLKTPLGIGTVLIANLLLLIALIYGGAKIIAKSAKRDEGKGPDSE